MRFLGLSAFVAVAVLTVGAGAQESADGNMPVSSSGVVSEQAVGPFAASPSDPGSASATADDSLATFSAAPETADDVWALWSLVPATGAIGIESILGSDDRTRNVDTTRYPERAMVLVTSSGGRCSGAMISVNTVLTAGHCVHGGGSSGAWATNVRVYPGRNGASSPYGSCGSRVLYSVVGWTRDRSEQYDYGVIKLDCSIGQTTGWLGFWWQTASLVGLEAIVDGYPGDKPLEQWRSTGTVMVNDSLQIFYGNDTVPGSSGSAVYTTRSSFCPGPCAMGIHAYGVHGSPPHGDHNHGVRITKPVFENLNSWRNAP